MLQPKKCKGYIGKPCASRQWDKVGVISAQKGTYLHQCQRCGRNIIIRGDEIPLTENPLEEI